MVGNGSSAGSYSRYSMAQDTIQRYSSQNSSSGISPHQRLSSYSLHSIADATVFGQIASVIYPFRCCINDVLEKDFPSVLEYCERIRAEIYPNDFTI
ncbi:Protein CBG15877 [Caenorhabditis briggsae]|uniref:Protein CBG15877 n=1 Tax=Caenorhabditis briggsae TaxID=6238 RepID=A8XMU1_CAEBR|nr:Protein CBG15877 [Caenorhabditis briggsae]CAP33967.1 Protein CBG15877 [Caenorhabditis briggsae]